MKRSERLCSCGAPALHRSPSRGLVYDRDHELCRRCWRGLQDRLRAAGAGARAGDGATLGTS